LTRDIRHAGSPAFTILGEEKSRNLSTAEYKKSRNLSTAEYKKARNLPTFYKKKLRNLT
jgi:hypothetical protein